MDIRRQKRLGPAPIASFEKSFEDNTTTTTPTPTNTTPTPTEATSTSTAQQLSLTMMEQKLLKQTTTTTTPTAAAAGSICGSSNGAANASASASANVSTTVAASTRATAPGSSTSSTSSSSTSTSTASSATCSAIATIVAKQRPPPLKTATTTVTTTLVSSNEGGQPLTPTGAPGGSNATYRGAATLTTPSTPRIELSRASSSSHHEEDSRESSPENVFEQVGTGTLQETIGLGFREEGALELRSSTEELYFMDPEQKREEQERLQQQQQQQQAKRSSPHIFKFDDHQSYLQQHQRKDSASSEVAALLCISGRTSRISSVGSQGSAVSRLSAISCVSRSPSPHRMLLETSFCGPKPLEAGADGGSNASTAPSSAHSLGEATLAVEQMLLARTKHDPTQAVLAEGIQMQMQTQTRPHRASGSGSKLANGESKSKTVAGVQRRSNKSPGQMVVGKMASGTEYIRINLRPDHMYSDKGIAANERVVEAPNQLTPVYSKGTVSKPPPASLSLQQGVARGTEQHLTPTASPKPARHALRLSSRSPSPAAAAAGGGAGVGSTVSRKSSFSSLFRLGKDSPDSPRESSRTRSKSKERTSSGSQNVTPSKQKSVLAIFKPGKRGSSAGTDGTKSSKSSSPIDGLEPPPPAPPPPLGASARSRTPIIGAGGSGSRPNSRLRYYDEPVEGVIHIPLHTPPEEREARTLLQGIQQLATAPSPPPVMSRAKPSAGVSASVAAGATPVVPAPAGAGAPITASQLAAAAAALRPVSQRKAAVTAAAPSRVDLNAIQTLPPHEELQHNTWEPHSQQEKQRENCIAECLQRLPSVDSTQSACEPRLVQTVATVNAPLPEDAMAKERRRLLFATRLGSGSQEQLFSTQFSISKTESQSSQLSEQVQLPDSGSTASDCTTDGLQRQGTVIRRTATAASSSEEEPAVAPIIISTAVVMRSKHKSCSNSEEETGGGVQPPSAAPTSAPAPTPAPPAPQAADVRHSRYLENFDVRKKYHENVTDVPGAPLDTGPTPTSPGVSGAPTVPRKPKRQSMLETKPSTSKAAIPEPETRPEPSPEPAESSEVEAVSPPLSGERAERHSTDEHDPIESSESERDSDMAGSSSIATAVPVGAEALKRHHFPRNVCLIEEHESTGLVSQESFDDELPYIPTTLPEERAQGVPLIPMKERANMELKTCPVDRPRSTTPLNPSHLEEYCTGIMTPQEAPHTELDAASLSVGPVRGEKLRISLPRKDSGIKDKGPGSSKSPRRTSNASGKSWFEFAEEGLRANNLERKDSNRQLLPASPAPVPVPTSSAPHVATPAPAPSTPASLEEPKPKASTQRKLSGHWIDFENIPEKRKPAKRITTLPKETITTTTSSAIITSASSSSCASAHRPSSHPHAHTHTHGHHHHHQPQGQSQSRQDPSTGDKLHYNYVKPEDCQCECHEAERGESSTATVDRDKDTSTGTGTGTGSDSLASVDVDLLQQGEDMLPLLEPEMQPETRIYTETEPLAPLPPPPPRHIKSAGSRSDEFPRRDAAQNSRNRKFPDRK